MTAFFAGFIIPQNQHFWGVVNSRGYMFATGFRSKREAYEWLVGKPDYKHREDTRRGERKAFRERERRYNQPIATSFRTRR